MTVRKFAVLLFLFTIASAFVTQAQDDDLKARREALRRCRALLKETIDNIDNGEYTVALENIDSVLVCDSSNADAYFHKARALIRTGDTTGAVSALETGTSKAPLSSRIRLLLARLKISRNAVDEALEQCNSVLAIKPNSGEALYLKGLVYMAQNDTTAAAGIFEKALDVQFAR